MLACLCKYADSADVGLIQDANSKVHWTASHEGFSVLRTDGNWKNCLGPETGMTLVLAGRFKGRWHSCTRPALGQIEPFTAHASTPL